MTRGIAQIRVEVWLEVIPQLIARIDHHAPAVSEKLNSLLMQVAREHPQALIYPITVTSNTASEARQRAGRKIIFEMRKISEQLVDEANLVSREMMQVAITWHEMWYQGLEDAANLYFTDKDVEGMLVKLDELHGNWQASEDSTMRVLSFIHTFGRDLHEAKEWVDKYRASREAVHLNQAWELYSMVFRRIKRQINMVDSLELEHVSPKLVRARNLLLAVPGTYRETYRTKVVRIKSFAPSVTVITSKQRPRRMTIYGSDGKTYSFLVKGHEDLRQDERVMQLFGLINALLANHPGTSKANLSINRFSVMPLSNNSGVIGWVPNCDTLQQLIRDYRESRNISMDLEKRLIWGISNEDGSRLDYDKLSTIQKVRV